MTQFAALRALYDSCGITLATYEAKVINGGNVVRCRLCGHGNGEPHSEHCGVGQFEAALCQRDERCEGRYPVPQTSPPRDEPFEVTYRCGLLSGHAGPHRSGV